MATKPLTSDELTELTTRPEQTGAQSLVDLEPGGAGNFPGTFAARLAESLSQRRGRAARSFRLRTARALAGSEFRRSACGRCCSDFDAYLNDKNTWCHQNAPQLHKNPVAYFSAEFGFHETLPIAAGGLGILAGDHAKSASDLGWGLRASVFFIAKVISNRRSITNNWQTEYYTLLNPKNLPLEPVLERQWRTAGLLGGNRHEPGVSSRPGA